MIIMGPMMMIFLKVRIVDDNFNANFHDQISDNNKVDLISVLLLGVPDLTPPILLLKFLANLKVMKLYMS